SLAEYAWIRSKAVATVGDRQRVLVCRVYGTDRWFCLQSPDSAASVHPADAGLAVRSARRRILRASRRSEQQQRQHQRSKKSTLHATPPAGGLFERSVSVPLLLEIKHAFIFEQLHVLLRAAIHG